MTDNKRYSFNWERGHPNFWDNYCDLADCYLTCEDVVNRLNELHKENNELRVMLNLCSDQRNEFHRGARENANRVGKLEKENEHIKQTIKTMLENERTELGQSVLKQLWEQIQ